MLSTALPAHLSINSDSGCGAIWVERLHDRLRVAASSHTTVQPRTHGVISLYIWSAPIHIYHSKSRDAKATMPLYLPYFVLRADETPVFSLTWFLKFSFRKSSTIARALRGNFGKYSWANDERTVCEELTMFDPSHIFQGDIRRSI